MWGTLELFYGRNKIKMSELTQCNYCKLRDIKYIANKLGKEVKIEPNSQHGGIDVLVKLPGEEWNREKHFVAWFMELGTNCGC